MVSATPFCVHVNTMHVIDQSELLESCTPSAGDENAATGHNKRAIAAHVRLTNTMVQDMVSHNPQPHKKQRLIHMYFHAPKTPLEKQKISKMKVGSSTVQ